MAMPCLLVLYCIVLHLYMHCGFYGFHSFLLLDLLQWQLLYLLIYGTTTHCTVYIGWIFSPVPKCLVGRSWICLGLFHNLSQILWNHQIRQRFPVEYLGGCPGCATRLGRKYGRPIRSTTSEQTGGPAIGDFVECPLHGMFFQNGRKCRGSLSYTAQRNWKGRWPVGRNQRGGVHTSLELLLSVEMDRESCGHNLHEHLTKESLVGNVLAS